MHLGILFALRKIHVPLAGNSLIPDCIAANPESMRSYPDLALRLMRLYPQNTANKITADAEILRCLIDVKTHEIDEIKKIVATTLSQNTSVSSKSNSR